MLATSTTASLARGLVQDSKAKQPRLCPVPQHQPQQDRFACQPTTARSPGPGYPLSTKVFAAPVPRLSSNSSSHCSLRVREAYVLSVFAEFQAESVEWPKTFNNNKSRNGTNPIPQSSTAVANASYCFIVFPTSQSVARLLASCDNGRYRGVEVLPWYTGDSIYVSPQAGSQNSRDPQLSVFVGGLHGLVTASALAGAFATQFGQVTHVCLDTDRYLYPTGSGQVTFATRLAAMEAAKCRFLRLFSRRYNRIIQVDPYLAYNSACLLCHRSGPLFCRETSCYSSFCSDCWSEWHKAINAVGYHAPLCRK